MIEGGTSLCGQCQFDPHVGLPEPLFLYCSSLVPMVNVDLLIQDNGKTLLAWRDDSFCGTGWHVPGGIVRLGETLTERVQKVIETEIGLPADIRDTQPKVYQVITPNKYRKHFISFLYHVYCDSSLTLTLNEGKDETTPGFLKWFDSCPDNLLRVQEMYRSFM